MVSVASVYEVVNHRAPRAASLPKKSDSPMKTTRLILATALFAGVATLSFAGPGPDYWARFEKEHAAARAKAAAKTPAAPQAAATCVNCNCPAMKKS